MRDHVAVVQRLYLDHLRADGLAAGLAFQKFPRLGIERLQAGADHHKPHLVNSSFLASMFFSNSRNSCGLVSFSFSSRSWFNRFQSSNSAMVAERRMYFCNGSMNCAQVEPSVISMVKG